MTIYGARIVDAAGNEPARGDHVVVRRTITDVPDGDPIAAAWLTLKGTDGAPDSAAILQLAVTTTETADGQIEEAGGGETAAVVRFEISGSNYEDILPKVPYFYDIQLRTAEGIIYTTETGRVTFGRDVTLTTTPPA